MSDLTDAAEGMAAAEDKTPSMEEAKALAESGEAEGTTPEEVAATLKSAGINLPPEPKAAAASEDEEEGADPDKPAAGEEEEAAPAVGEEDAGDEELGDEEEEPAEDPNAKPLEQRAADEDRYSIEATDANGVTYKIPVGAKMEDILAEFEPKNNGQILDILDQLRDLKDQKAKDDAAEASNTAKAEQAQRASEIRDGWNAESADLQAQKRIPEGETGDKRIADVYKYMADENGKRMEAGRPTLNSFEDALDKLEAKEGRDKAVADAKAEKETARANGGKVGGSSAAASNAAPTYKAGSARNANEAIRAMGLL